MNKVIFSILITASMVSLSAEVGHESKNQEGHAHESGKGHQDAGAAAGPHWMSPKEESEKVNPMMSDMASVDRGKKSYFQYCAACHGAKALGDGPAAASMTPKPANLKVMAGGHPDGDFAWKISNGRGAMPGWKAILNENEIWDLVNYIQNLNPKGKKMDMSKMDHSKMNMEGMPKMDMSKMNMEDIQKMMPNIDMSNMNMEDMQKMMANMDMSKMNMENMQKMMPNMDHSKMNMEDMQKMMSEKKKSMTSNHEHSNSGGHHEEKTKTKSQVINSHSH